MDRSKIIQLHVEKIRKQALEILLTNGGRCQIVSYPIRYRGMKRIYRVGRLTDVGEVRAYMLVKGDSPSKHGPNSFNIPWVGIQRIRSLDPKIYATAEPREEGC